MGMNYKAVGHRILVRPYKVEDTVKTTNGSKIYKPQQTIQDEKGAVDRGVVVDIGPDAYRGDGFSGKSWCAVGDEVVWPRYAGKPMKGLWDQDADLHVLNDEDVLAVVVCDQTVCVDD